MCYLVQMQSDGQDSLLGDATNCRLSDMASEVASAVVRVAGDIALVIGPDGVIRNVADGSLQLAGSGASWVGRNWADTVSHPMRPKVQSLLQEAQSLGVSRRRELSHVAAEGGNIPVSWAAVRLGDGGPLLAVGRDMRTVSAIQQRFVDAQKDLERDYWQRRSAEAHYRLLFQVAHDAVLVLDAEDGNVLDANPAAHALFGHTGANWAGSPLGPYLQASARPALEELLLAARSTGHATELRLRTAEDGAPLDVSATPFSAEGRHCLLLRARHAEDLVGDMPDARDFIGQTPDAVVVTDTSGRVLWANPAFLAMCQANDESSIKGHAIAEVLGAPQHQWTALLARVRARGIVGNTTVQLRVGDAALSRTEVSAALLAEGDQEHIGFTLRAVAASAPASDAAQNLALAVAALSKQMGKTPLAQLLAEASCLVETHFIQAALQAADCQLDVAAHTLRISSQSLVQRMDSLGVPLPAPRGDPLPWVN